MKPIYLSIQQKATGNRIKRLLQENGYTVKDIQEVMGFENPQAVYKWLSGRSLPSLDNLLILSRVLHTSIEDILVIDGDIVILGERRYTMNNVWDKTDFWYERKRPWKLPELIFRNIKYSWQRITKGYCNKDLWNIDYWFMSLMPDMLQQFKNTRHGSPGILGKDYTNDDGILCNDECHAEWDKILEQMIFLFREMNEEACQKKNPYEAEHDRVYCEFEEKYGSFGERIERTGDKEPYRRLYFPNELPEYKEIEKKYFDAEKELSEYRERCKNQAFELFSKWFYALWD